MHVLSAQVPLCVPLPVSWGGFLYLEALLSIKDRECRTDQPGLLCTWYGGAIIDHPTLSNCNRYDNIGVPPDLWSLFIKPFILPVPHLPSILRKVPSDGRRCRSPSREEKESGRGSGLQNITATRM